MVNLIIAAYLALILLVFEVSAYPPRHNNYLLHDTHQDFKAGTSSSPSEIDFHPLSEFTAMEPSEHHHSQQQEYKHHHRPQDQQYEKEQQHQKFSSNWRDLLFLEPTEMKAKKFAARYPFGLERRANLNLESYEDIDDIYKQDMAQGNDNIRDWNSNESKDWLKTFKDEGNFSDGQKRNAFHAIKRQKSKKHQSQFIPSISVGAMSSLGDFFDNLKNNIEFLEQKELTPDQLQLLDGEHPAANLKKEFASTSGESDGTWNNQGPHGTAAFLHAIRTYRPSQRIRTLVSSVPEGYRGSNSLDPNYMWMGLGKRN